MVVTQDMLFENNVKRIVNKLQNDYSSLIQWDLDKNQNTYPDLLTWLELHPDIIGKAFMKHIIEFGITNEDITQNCEYKQ